MQRDPTFLVSGFGFSGGGLFEVTAGHVTQIDDIPCTGLGVGSDRVWRVLRAPGEHTGLAELITYDGLGVRRYDRLDEIRDPHDLCLHRGQVHIVSSWDNAVWRIGDDGSTTKVWQPTTVPDAWHPNGLASDERDLYVTAFARTTRHRDWNGNGGGMLHAVTAGKDVVTGLHQPHSPRRVPDGWWLCESGRGDLLSIGGHAREHRRIEIGGYTRGLAISGPVAMVGVNASRHAEDSAKRASVVTVDLERGTILDRVVLPCAEVYDIVEVPESLLHGVQRGFATNAHRVAEAIAARTRAAGKTESSHLELTTPAQAAFVAVSNGPAAQGELDGEAIADLPRRWTAGAQRAVVARVVNRSDRVWTSVLPNPLSITARWYATTDGGEAAPIVGTPAPLPQPLEPGGATDVDVIVTAPDQPGRYRLAITLHQHGGRWFGRRSESIVDVRA